MFSNISISFELKVNSIIYQIIVINTESQV